VQIARLKIQLQQVIHVRIRPAEFENSLEFIKIPKPIDLLPGMNR
jgi:hypothetical protein